jgi:hypothetical protein
MRIRSLAILSLAIALPVLGSGTAEALTLHTPFVRVNSVQHIRVDVTNLSTKQITTTVTCTNSIGGAYPTAGDSCNGATLDPRTTCLFLLADNQGGFCTVVSSSGKVRAAINVLGPAVDGSPLVTVVPATK